MLKSEDIVSADMPIAGIADAVRADTPDVARIFAGAMVRHAIAAGEALRLGDVLQPGDHGFMAAVLQPGMRAVTIGVDATSGSTGLVWPGDRVDLILTQTLTDPSLPLGRRVVAETVLTNARAIAIDQQLMQGGAPAGADAQRRTVTLEVDTNQARRVSVAMRIGHLSLSVLAARPSGTDKRSIETHAPDGTVTNSPDSVFARDVSPALIAGPRIATVRVIRVFRGSAAPTEFKY